MAIIRAASRARPLGGASGALARQLRVEGAGTVRAAPTLWRKRQAHPRASYAPCAAACDPTPACPSGTKAPDTGASAWAPYKSFRDSCYLCRYDQCLYYGYGARQDLNWASYWILEDPGTLISALYVVSWVSSWALAGPGMEGRRGQRL